MIASRTARSFRGYALLLLVVALVAAASAGAGTMITGRQIKDATVTSVDLKDSTVRGIDLRDASIRSSDIASGGVTGPDIASSAVDRSKLASDVRPVTDQVQQVDFVSLEPTADYVVLNSSGNLEVSAKCVDAGGGIGNTSVRLRSLANNAKLMWTTLASTNTNDANHFVIHDENLGSGGSYFSEWTPMVQGNAHYIASTDLVNFRYFADGGDMCMVHGTLERYRLPAVAG